MSNVDVHKRCMATYVRCCCIWWEKTFQVDISKTLFTRLIICVNNVNGTLYLKSLTYVDTTWYWCSETCCKEVKIVHFLIHITICFMHVSIPRFVEGKMQTLLMTYLLGFKNVFVVCSMPMFINIVWQRLSDVVATDEKLRFRLVFLTRCLDV